MQQKNSIISQLNESQKRAVVECNCNLLIIAGAGSGKTKTLTHKIAYILEEGLAKPSEILALTFTNKAANEMKERIVNIVGESAKNMWIGTFHSIALRILRVEGFKPTIYDSKDQESLIKEILKKLNIDQKKYTPKALLSKISHHKLNMEKPENIPETTPFEKIVKKVYAAYEKELESAGALDFDNIILKTIELFESNEEVRKKYSQRFKYIFIDEYQDTNYPQYYLVKLLSTKNNYVCAVGDEDQSIYSFRGAKVENIMKFDKEYDNCKVIKLTKNYRSAQEILNIANTLISKNSFRNEKTLYSDKIGGKITIKELPTDSEEAEFVAEKIIELKSTGESLNDIAILYRTNHQSRSFEEALIRNSIPYSIIGSKRFLERKEVKDVLAYLKLISNPRDNVSFLRAISSHPRGIGKALINKISSYSDKHNLSLFEASLELQKTGELSKKQQKALKEFTEIFSDLDRTKSVDELIDEILEKSGYKNYLAEKSDYDRMSNVEELKNAGDISNLDSFLDSLSLLDYSDELNNNSEFVKLMTIHAAKGLEFNTVFVVGLEEGLFPNENLKKSELDIEEERRLFYVAITRAKTNLFITHAQFRKRNNQYLPSKPSRFLKDIMEQKGDRRIERGTKVLHTVYGRGVVLSRDENLLTINFGENGIKKVLTKDRNLTVM